ncbi:MAG: RpiB/LacA/LacB family sugar-phosphate isomerase [Kiritimatiellae bacterium]|nr:RpiB/LacA/LacB family sugar-phosphate isomerase [Kiritimatiellia bacterium]
MKTSSTRRAFLTQVGKAGTVLAGAGALTGHADNPKTEVKQTMTENKKIIVAADPFAVPLKDQIVAFLKERGYEVTDYSKTQGQDRPYFDSAVAVCEAMQAGAAPRALLFCGTGMGMSIVANRFRGVTAAVVESVFAAKMCRAINNANVLCLGQMIWGTEMAKAAVEAFLNTKFTEGLEGLSGFLHDTCKKVEAIRP